jgi:hypothetical protein
LRTNTITNPTCNTGSTGWTQVNAGAGTTTGVRMTTGGLAGVFSTYFRQTWTAVTTGAFPSTGIVVGSTVGATVPVVGGQPWALSAYSRSSHAGRLVQFIVTYYSAPGVTVGGVDSSAAVDVSGGWTRVSMSKTAPAGALWAYVRLYAAGGTPWAVNDTLDLGGTLVETGTSVVGQYFDGATLGCQWSGTAGASSSTWLMLASTVLRKNVCPNPSLGANATGWVANGGGVTRVAQGTGWAAQVEPATGVTFLAAPFSLAAEVGTYWAGAVTVSGPAGRQVEVKLYDGTRYVTSVFVVTLTGSPLVVLPRSTDPIAAGDVGTIELVVYPQGTWAAGELLTATQAVVEQVPDTNMVTTSGVWDGESPNAGWSGTQWNSESAQIVLAPRSNFPAVEIEAWPGVAPTMVGVPSGASRFLTDRARGLKIGRGRQYELAQDEAASGSLVVNNSDGSVTGGTYGCTPITSCRVRAVWNGITYPVWTGLIRSWPREDKDPSVAWSEVELTDTFEPLANREFGSIMQEEIQYQTSPDAWYPMNEPESSTSIGSLVPGGPPAKLVNFKGGGIPFALGGESVFAGTSDTVLTLANATGTTNVASQYQVVGPQNPTGYSMKFGQPWGVGVFVRMTAGAAMVWSALDRDGTIMAGIKVDAGASQIIGYSRLGGPGASMLSLINNTGAMQLGCFVHLGHDGTNAFCYVYGINTDGSLYAVASSGAEPVTTGTSTWVSWGCAFRSDVIYYSSNADMQLAHGVIWTTSPPAPYTNPLIGIATAGLNAFAGYKGKDQIGFLAEWAGVAPVGGDALDGQPLGQVRDTDGSSALDALRAITGDYLGRIFMGKDGSLVWQSVHHGMASPITWTLGGQSGEQPYTGSPGFDFDPTYVYNDVQVQRPDTRGVAQQATATKALARAVDTVSAGEYFQRVLQVDSNVQSDADAAGLAGYLLNGYAQPDMRVRTVRFDPSANPALWPFILGAELGDTVVLNHRAIGRPDLHVTLSIQSIDHEVDAQAGSWVTDMELSPWTRDWVLAAMHTTLTAAVAVGATSISLAPLPDSGTNPAEASLGVGTTLTIAPGTANAETVTVASVASVPTPRVTGYTSITVGLTAATTKAHSAGDVVCDPLPSGVTDPTTWDAWSVLGTTTRLSV